MSGYLVTTDNGNDHRNLFMVNNPDPKAACAEVNGWMNMDNAEALVPVSDATIDFFEVVAGKPWLYTTAHSRTGKATNSLFADDGRRGVLR